MFSHKRIRSHKIWITAGVLILAAWAGVARADILELRTGEIVQGKFLGGSPLNIRFQVNGKEQVFATKDVLNIGFGDPGQASNALPATDSSAAGPSTSANGSSGDASSATTADAAPDSSATPPPPPPADAQSTGVPPVSYAPAPDAQGITIPAGTTVLVRMIDSVDSSNNRIGDTFRASLEGPLVVGNTVIASKGAEAYGKLTQAKDSGKISGTPELTLELTGIRIKGNVVPLDSTDYNVAGKSRGAQSAKRIGGGAVVGAVIGGIIGGPGGAAIGASLGAGGGTAVQVATHGEHVRVPSETLLEFRLQQDVTAPSGASATPAN